jgi:hypothetical protein
MSDWGMIFAQTTTTPPRYEFARIAGYENWQFALLGLICLAIAGFVIYMYRRDSAELKPGVGILLLVLRVLAFSGLLLHFLNLQKLSEKIKTENSVAIIGIDGSASMNRQDGDGANVSSANPTRTEAIIKSLKTSPVIDKLRQLHDVVIYRFDNEASRIGILPKHGTEGPTETVKDKPSDKAPDAGTDATPKLVLPNNPADWPWAQVLEARGSESRYGQSLRQMILEEKNRPLSGVLMVGDFSHNSGAAPEEGIKLAKEQQLKVHTIVVGSNKIPVNAAVTDFRVPPRVYPEDKFQINALIQGTGLNNRQVEVKLYVKPTDPNNRDDSKLGELIANESLAIKANEDTPFVYESPGIPTAGRLTYTVVVEGISEDSNPTDNRLQADVEVVERKNRVLLFAGGPTREYQFLRNQLRRDKYTVVDVLIQNAKPGISQDANKILDDFPRTITELTGTKDAMGLDQGGYDAIVAFDPDWRKLDEEQLEVLDRWLARESGGLILVAGPVFMDAWLEEKGDLIKKVRSFYPVEFDRRLLAFDNSKFVNEVPWPIEFTSEGLGADFLWLGSTAEESVRNWADFDGVYGFYQVSRPKPGAVVYGYFSNPDVAISGKPIYFAEQFWGSGRVFYMGSGEMWRLNETASGWFEQVYTKLVRHVSQGRLLRGSRLGSLLIERDRYSQGNIMPIRAQLQNLRLDPYEAKSVAVEITQPNGGTPRKLDLKADPVRKGFYNGQFTLLQTGTYQISLVHPEASDVLMKRIQVSAPQLEVDNPQRDDVLAKKIADGTQGKFLIGMESLLAELDSKEKLAAFLPDQKTEKIEAKMLDREFQEQWAKFLMFAIVGLLALEWIIRRLCRLA